ncbi:MAG: hypothetical protein HLUCCA11_23080 [Phormidesmis priestleyi Ana]|uniref:Uncharacterized protein n=1 Tax=Phormidesmis priestleyi Ana TaxID=1666911 RepID=A0A0P7ZAP9_9CYAN|nr:MAG: hypothetical protein HLUCCA11_23080 [Phormidesmis priestleyi Ana]
MSKKLRAKKIKANRRFLIFVEKTEGELMTDTVCDSSFLGILSECRIALARAYRYPGLVTGVYVYDCESSAWMNLNSAMQISNPLALKQSSKVLATAIMNKEK